MNQHLSSEQISKFLTGDATPEETSHLQDCDACGADLTRLEAAVSSFRDTVRNWSDQTSTARQMLPDSTRKPMKVQVLRFAMAAALVVIMVGVPMWRLKQRQSDIANQDEVLLEQIASGLSRSVAQPMHTPDQTLDHERQYRTGRVPMKRRSQLWGGLFLAAGLALAQPPRREGGGPPPPPPPPRAVHDVLGGPPGKWWDNPEMARKLKLSSDQQRKMDEIFQQSRLKLIDVNATLQKEEALLEPLVQVEQPDDSKVLPQIDRVAQARSELEKVDGRVLLALRHVLTPEQWRLLQEENPNPPRPPRR